jgi:hypothetical protein
MWDNFQRIIEHFTQIIVKALQNMVLGSGIRETEQTPFRIPDPGVKKAPDPGAVLSLTVDKVIQSSLFQAPALSRDGSRAGSNSCSFQYSSRATAATGAIFSVGTSVPQLDAGSGSVSGSALNQCGSETLVGTTADADLSLTSIYFVVEQE